MAIGAGDVDRCAFHPGAGHLAGKGPFPDQIIELALIWLSGAQLARVARHVRGADTFVRLLGVFGFVFVNAGAVGDVFRAVAILDGITRHLHGLGRHIDAVGPHVCDVACLIEALRGAHGLARAHAEFPAGLLLQGGGHEGRGGVAVGGFCLHRVHRQIAAADRLDSHFGLRLILNIIAVQLFARQRHEARLECLAPRRG